VALLMVSALGGLTTLAADVRPFSQGRNAATWLQRHHLDDAFLMSSSDYAGSTVSGYLRRPLYYLECECYGTYIVWNTRRKQSLDIEEVVDRVARVMRADDKNEAYSSSAAGTPSSGRPSTPISSSGRSNDSRPPPSATRSL
jgi:hypothetical protein